MLESRRYRESVRFPLLIALFLRMKLELLLREGAIARDPECSMVSLKSSPYSIKQRSKDINSSVDRAHDTGLDSCLRIAVVIFG